MQREGQGTACLVTTLIGFILFFDVARLLLAHLGSAPQRMRLVLVPPREARFLAELALVALRLLVNNVKRG